MILRSLSLLILLVIFMPVYPQINITEIKFIEQEFIELKVNQDINFSDFYIYDDNGFSKNNSITQIKESNSSFHIIGGSQFIETLNLSALNCNIYQTSGSQLSNGGLKSNGEEILISNSTYNISWKPDKEYLFNSRDSLHFYNNLSLINTSNKCQLTQIQLNLSDTSENNISLCLLDIQVYLRNITDKIEYKFISNLSQNNISYWIEDYKNNILKKPLITTNTNKKSYTPSKPGPIIIKAKEQNGNCSYSIEEEVYFWKEIEVIEEEVEEKEDLDSKIIILKANQNQNLLELDLELIRGDSSKRTYYIYLNEKQIHSIELPNKNTKTKLRLLINLVEGENEIIITGLDLEQDLKFQVEKIQDNIKEQIVIEKEELKTTFFNISINNNILQRALYVAEEREVLCYVNRGNKKVSNEYNLVLSPGFYIITNIINESKIKYENSTLKHICKHKTLQTKSYHYATQEFMYQKQEKKNNNITQKLIQEIPQQENITYISSSTKIKQQSEVPILIGLSTLLIGFILLW